MPVTPADVRNKQFATTRLRPGYDEDEVDAFLDEVEAELERLLRENQELRAKLADCLRGGQPAVAALKAASAEPEPPMMAAGPVAPASDPRPEPVMMGMPGGDDMGTAARVLVLAQQTADQAIADARREAGETLGWARREADQILGTARAQAEQVASDARARAEILESDAQERHREALGSLVVQREELKRQVDDLRAFERAYRGRLKAYLEGQLRDLEATATDSAAFPVIMTGPPQPPPTGPQYPVDGKHSARQAHTPSVVRRRSQELAAIPNDPSIQPFLRGQSGQCSRGTPQVPLAAHGATAACQVPSAMAGTHVRQETGCRRCMASPRAMLRCCQVMACPGAGRSGAGRWRSCPYCAPPPDRFPEKGGATRA